MPGLCNFLVKHRAMFYQSFTSSKKLCPTIITFKTISTTGWTAVYRVALNIMNILNSLGCNQIITDLVKGNYMERNAVGVFHRSSVIDYWSTVSMVQYTY